jgi:hypothetical protein
MKLFYGKWWFGVEWKKHEKHDIYLRYFYPFNWIDIPKHRYWGHQEYYYDGPLPSFGFWFFNVTWCFE